MIPGNLPVNIDLIGTAVAAVLTFCVFSYLLGDLPGLGALFKFLYRLVLHVLVGAGVAYALLVAWWSILYPRVVLRFMDALARNDVTVMGLVLIGAVLGVLVWTKLVRSLAWLGNISTGYLVGVGLGVATGGALIGTLFAQSQATATLLGANAVLPGLFLVNALILVVGTLTVLISFSFTATGRAGLGGLWARVVRVLSVMGRFFLYVALGTAFAGAYAAGVAVLVGRVQAVLAALAEFGILR